MTTRPHTAGFSLIELLMVVLLVSVLATIALPNYRSYVLRANRTEARAALLGLATAQERFYLQCHGYGASLGASTTCSPMTLAFPASSERGYYSVSVTQASTTGWSAVASAAVAKPQYADTQCRTFRLTSTGAKSSTDTTGAESGAECWNR
jgi:type IV pilus assembly protein PilE